MGVGKSHFIDCYPSFIFVKKLSPIRVCGMDVKAVLKSATAANNIKIGKLKLTKKIFRGVEKYE